MQFIASNVSRSLELTERSKPSMQFFVTFTTINNMEMIIGKLKTAIKMLLLFAFAAMPDKSESEAEKPIAPSTSSRANNSRSAIGFLSSVMNSMNPVNDKRSERIKL